MKYLMTFEKFMSETMQYAVLKHSSDAFDRREKDRRRKQGELTINALKKDSKDDIEYKNQAQMDTEGESQMDTGEGESQMDTEEGQVS